MESRRLIYALAAHLRNTLGCFIFEKKTIYLIQNKFFIKKKKLIKKVLPLLICVLPVIFIGFLIVIFFKKIIYFEFQQ